MSYFNTIPWHLSRKPTISYMTMMRHTSTLVMYLPTTYTAFRGPIKYKLDRTSVS